MKLLFLLVSSFGMMDAGYLTRQHYTGGTLICPIFGGCETVTNSIYSEIFGFPIAGLGLIFYSAIFLLSLIAYFSEDDKYLKIASLLTPFGFLTTLVLVFLMIFVIKAICFYCVISAISSTVLFILGLILLRREWTKKQTTV